MNVLLTGASGFLGRHIAAALADVGHRVLPVSRRHGVDAGQMRTPQDWRALLDGVDAVVNAIGIIGQTRRQRFAVLHTEAPLALFQASLQAGVRRVVQISALGADASACSAYHLSKRAADDGLRRLPLDWFVLRPALVYGEGGANAAAALRLAALPWIPVVGRGEQMLQPVHVGDVVASVLRCLAANAANAATTASRTLDLVGPEAFTCAQWLRRLRQAQGLAPARLLCVPEPLVLGLAALGRGMHPMLRPENIRMLQRGCTADAGPLERFLRRPLRPAAPERLRLPVATRSAV
jgi:uncharacterized protein YbjT (DUF2867 family)